METKIIISITKETNSLLIKKLKINNIKFQKIEKVKFDGLSEITQIIIAVSAVTIPILGKVIIETIKHSNNKDNIQIKYKNFEFKGNLNKEELLSFFKQIIKIEQNENS